MRKLLIFFVLTKAILSYANSFDTVIPPILNRAKQLAHNHALNPKKPKPIIAIAGCSGVGKTYFTKELARLLKKEKIRVAIFKEDDFNQPTIVKNALIHKHFDHYRLHNVIRQILDGTEHVIKPIWDSYGSTRIKEDVVACFWNIDLILFEGTYTLCDSKNYDFLKYSSLRIFIEATDENILTWNWEREMEHPLKARTREKFDNDAKWDMDDYHQTILPTKKYADFIINLDENHSYSIQTN